MILTKKVRLVNIFGSCLRHFWFSLHFRKKKQQKTNILRFLPLYSEIPFVGPLFFP